MALRTRGKMFAAVIAAHLIGGSLGDPASAATFEVVRELAAPQHFFEDAGPDAFAYDVLAFASTPNFTFAIGDYDTVRLRLVAPAGTKIVVSAPAFLSWYERIAFARTDSPDPGVDIASGPSSLSFTTVSGTPPSAHVIGFETSNEWISFGKSSLSPGSATFECTEIIISVDVSSLTGASHTYTILDGGGFSSGPEVAFIRVLPTGSPDPGPFVSLQPAAATFEVVRELAAPQHYFFDDEFLGAFAHDVLAFAAAPNFTFAIGDYDTVRLRLVPPAGMKIVVSAAVFFSWPGDLNLLPTNSPNSGVLTVAPASLSFTTASGTPPVPSVQGFKTADDWLKIRSEDLGTASSSSLEVTEIVLSWDVSSFTGASRTYTMFDAGGYSSGPEVSFLRSLPTGSPDPGQFVSLQPVDPPIVPVFGPSAQAWLALALVLAAAPFLARARARVGGR